jgi:cell division protein FtsB
MKVGQLFAEQLEKLKVDTSDESLKAILGISIDIPDEVAQKIQSGLVTLDAAKSDSGVKDHFISSFVKGNDRNLKEYLDSEKASEEEVKAVFSHASFKDRYAAALALIKDKSNAAIEDIKKKGLEEGVSKQKMDAALVEENKKLNAQIHDLKTNYIPKTDYEKVISDHERERMDEKINGAFLTENWSKNFVPELRPTLAKIALESELNKRGIILVRTPEGISPRQKENPEMPYYDNSKKLITFPELVKSVMTTNKFEEQSDTPGPFHEKHLCSKW